MATDGNVDLPTWDLTTIYPSVDSEEYLRSVDRLISLIDAHESLLTAAEALDSGDFDAVTPAFDGMIGLFNEALGLARHNRWYLQAHVSEDTRDQAAQARMSELEAVRSRRTVAEKRFVAWLSHIDVEALIAASSAARDQAFLLRQAQVAAAHQMDQPREALAAALQESGGTAWSRLQDVLASQIMVAIEMPDGETVHVPMSETSVYSINPDRDVRRRAYDGKQAAWQLWRQPFAAALNGVKGEQVTLARARGWSSVLEESLFQNRLDRASLDAMLDASRRSLPDFRRFLKAKARALGIDTLAWYDLWAPFPGSLGTWPWDECAAFVVDQFDTYSTALGGLARRALDERWIDAGPRANKDGGGGWCMPLDGGASRVLLNHIDTFDDVLAMAHELGHAYHNLCDSRVSPWRRESRPTILAETASTFCETLVARTAVSQSSEAERLNMLDAWLMAANLSVAAMLDAFDFEDTLFEKRAERELSAEELSLLEHDTRAATFGDALDASALSPHSWEAVPHYYMTSRPYYNYPYTFGLLFGLGLYARYRDDADTFRGQFDELLTSTGDADAATFAARFGFDLHSPDF